MRNDEPGRADTGPADDAPSERHATEARPPGPRPTEPRRRRSDAPATAGAAESAVLMDYPTAEHMCRHMRQYATEIGGLLLGRREAAGLVITGVVFPPQRTSNAVLCEFDAQSLDRVHQAVDRMTDPAAAEETGSVAGWVHSHPGLGVFMSDQDRRTLGMWTGLMDGAVAMVADPARLPKHLAIGVWGRDCRRLELVDSPGAGLTLRQAVHLAEALRSLDPGYGYGKFWTIVCAEGLLRVLPRETVEAEG